MCWYITYLKFRSSLMPVIQCLFLIHYEHFTLLMYLVFHNKWLIKPNSKLHFFSLPTSNCSEFLFTQKVMFAPYLFDVIGKEKQQTHWEPSRHLPCLLYRRSLLNKCIQYHRCIVHETLFVSTTFNFLSNFSLPLLSGIYGCTFENSCYALNKNLFCKLKYK